MTSGRPDYHPDVATKAKQIELVTAIEAVILDVGDLETLMALNTLAIASLETQTDLVTDEVALSIIQIDLVTTSVNLRATSTTQNLMKTALDNIKTKTDNLDASTSSLKTQVDLVTTAVDTMKLVLDDVKGGTDKIISAPATSTTQNLIKTAIDNIKTSTDKIISSPATSAKQTTLATAINNVKTGTDKIVTGGATATGVTAVKTAVDLVKGVLDNVKTGTDKIISDGATEAKQNLQATSAKQVLLQTSMDNIKDKTGSTVEASNNLKLSSDAIVSEAGSTYVKVKEFQINFPGSYRIKFDLRSSAPAVKVAYGRIYKNGVAFGTEWGEADTAYVTQTEDLFFNTGDLLQLYLRISSSGEIAYVRNLRIYCDLGVSIGGEISV